MEFEKFLEDVAKRKMAQVPAQNSLHWQTFVEVFGSDDYKEKYQDDKNKQKHLAAIFKCFEQDCPSLTKLTKGKREELWRYLRGEFSKLTSEFPRLSQSIREGLDRQYFVGRDDDLKQLHRLLQLEPQKGARVAIMGMGGLGKTELALQYAKEYHNFYMGGIYEIRVQQGRESEERQESIVSQLISLTQGQFSDRDVNALTRMMSRQDRARWCWQQLQAWLKTSQAMMLIIVDDVVDYAEVKDYLPPNELVFRILLTTRTDIPTGSTGIVQHKLETLSEVAALQLLELVVGKERTDAEQESAQELCRDVGYLPLALELVANYLGSERRKNMLIRDILVELKLRGLAHASVIRAEYAKNWAFTAERGIKAAFELSWQELDADAQHLAAIFAVFGFAPVLWEWVESVERYYGMESVPTQEFNQDALAQALDRLLDLHLIKKVVKQVGEEWYELHALIYRYFREKLNELV